MISFTGKKLEEYILAIPGITDYKKRFCYDNFKDLVVNTRDMRVIALYGLRRTGKSVLMTQLIIDIGQYDNICLIKCNEGDDMSELRTSIEGHKQCKYIFIDEATRLENFATEASDLSDIYSSGHRIIMAGTDSLGLYIGKQYELYGRIHMLHTTYMPYKEYNYLLGKDLDDYIMYGGTLTPENDFYNQERSQEYSNASIAENIQHSLDGLGRNGEYGVLATFRHNGELTTFFNKIIELYNRQFTLDIVNSKFKTHDILVLRHYNRRNSDADYEQLNTKINISFRKEIMNALHIIDNMSEKATDKAITEAKKYLQALDVIYPIPDSDEVIFTQPGLRYSQCTAQINVISRSYNINFTEEQRQNLSQTLDNDIKGRMLEDIIYYQLAKDNTFNQIFTINKFNTPLFPGEFDLTLITKETNEAYIIEVKHSNKAVEHQARHLNNEDLCTEFENTEHATIIGKMVIYMGNTIPGQLYGVNYINAEDFLLEPIKMLNMVHTLQNQPPAITATYEDGTPEDVFTKAYNRSYEEHESHDIAAVAAARALYKSGFDRITVISTVDNISPLADTDVNYTRRIIRKAEQNPQIQQMLQERQEQQHNEKSR